MYLLFLAIIIILLLICLQEHRKTESQKKELLYICRKIETMIQEDANEFIMVPTENEVVKKVASTFNHLLETYYKRQSETRRYQRTIMQVLTNVSHDLKTPLTVLKGYTEILKVKAQEAPVEEDVKKMIEKLDKKTGEIVRLVNQFFNMAKLESGDTILHIQRLNVGQICREIMLEYFDILEQKKCEVRIQIPDKPIYADVDSEALSRILKNLIDNAIKYGYDGKFLGITVKEAAQVIMIEIEDHGKGIKDSEKELIFERTFALGNEHKHGTQSNGIGLSISRNLAKQMGADISVSSQPDFKTIFTIKLSKN